MNIKIYHEDLLVRIGVYCGGCVCLILWAWMLEEFAVWRFLITAPVTAALLVFCWHYYGRPLVMEADDREVRWRHLGGWTTLRIAQITALSCETYTVGTRARTTRLRLIITTADQVYELNDRAFAEELLHAQIAQNSTAAPLVQMYHFLKSRAVL